MADEKDDKPGENQIYHQGDFGNRSEKVLQSPIVLAITIHLLDEGDEQRLSSVFQQFTDDLATRLIVANHAKTTIESLIKWLNSKTN